MVRDTRDMGSNSSFNKVLRVLSLPILNLVRAVRLKQAPSQNEKSSSGRWERGNS